MRAKLIALTLAFASASSPAFAQGAVADPTGDFLSTYTGALNSNLDITSASATYDGTSFRLSATTNGAIGSTTGNLYVFGINRGAGTARLTLGSPSVGSGILFDAVAVLFPDGSGRIAVFPAAGAPTITLLPGAITVNGNVISGVFPASLLPSTGLTTSNYGFSLWSRLRVNPAQDGTNAEIADFAPGGSTFLAAAIPEPETWLSMLVGFAMTGAALRKRRTPASARLTG